MGTGIGLIFTGKMTEIWTTGTGIRGTIYFAAGNEVQAWLVGELGFVQTRPGQKYRITAYCATANRAYCDNGFKLREASCL